MGQTGFRAHIVGTKRLRWIWGRKTVCKGASGLEGRVKGEAVV